MSTYSLDSRRMAVGRRLRVGAAIAAGWLGLAGTALATFPGENGPVVFSVIDGAINQVKIARVSVGSDKITTLYTGGRSPRVSPNGRRIVFQRGADGIGVMNIDGTEPTVLRSTGTFPSWAPNASKIAFLDTGGIWTMNPDGSSATLVGPLSSGYTGALNWAPSGNNFALVRAEGIFTINPFSQPEPVYLTPGDNVSWAPAADRVMALRFKDSGDTLWDVPLSGTPTQVPGQVTGSAAVSPDGQFLANGLLTSSGSSLLVRGRTGTPTVATWPLANTTVVLSYNAVDWARVPKGCFSTTSSGGGVPLPADINFYADQCAIVVMPDGGAKNGVLQYLFAIGQDRRIYTSSLVLSRSGGQPAWTPMTLMNTLGAPPGYKASKISAAGSRDGGAQVVFIGGDDNLVYYTVKDPAAPNFGLPVALNGPGGAPTMAARDVAISISNSTDTSPGQVQVVASDLATGTAYHRLRASDGSWTPFEAVPGFPGGTVQRVGIAASDDGYSNVVAVVSAATGGATSLLQTARSPASWTPWVTVGLPDTIKLSATSTVAVGRRYDSRALLMFTDAAGNAQYQERGNPNAPASWEQTVPATVLMSTTARGVAMSAAPSSTAGSMLMLVRTYPQ
jgi:hypothetical protein